ncbi:hypothetical protein ACWPN4_01580 [Gordonia polyisoprenivorans]
MSSSELLQRHVREGKVAFGINREMNDWSSNRKKDLDLVVARTDGSAHSQTFDLRELAEKLDIHLTAQEKTDLNALPTGSGGEAGATVLVALEAKACMTEHSKAAPRLHDELTASFHTVHGDNAHALAIGLVMINNADAFISPERNKTLGIPDEVTIHNQPKATEKVISKVGEINRRPGPASGKDGFDALGIIVVDLQNDGSPVELIRTPPAPQANSPFHWNNMILRAASIYDSTYANV